MTVAQKSEWLNKHLRYRYLMLVGIYIEHKNGLDIDEHINICLVESSYTALRGFIYFLLDDSLIKEGNPRSKKRAETDVTIDKLGGRKITELKEDERKLLNYAIRTCDKHVAHFTLEMEDEASGFLGESVKLVVELLHKSMSELEVFAGSGLQKVMAEHKNLPFV